MKSVANWQKSSPDPAVEEIMRAMQEIVPADKAGPSTFDWDDEPAAPASASPENHVKPTVSENHIKPTVSQSIEQAAPGIGERFVGLGQRFAFSKVYAWGLIALVGVGAYVFVWSSPTRHSVQPTTQSGQAAPAPVPAAAMQAKQAAAPAASAAQTADVSNPAQPLVLAQALPQLKEQIASAGPEVMLSPQSLERRLTNLEQGIEEIKNAQAKLTGSNAELGASFKLAQEKLFLSIGNLVTAMRAAEERGTQERLSVAEQLKLNQDQLAKISEQLKASQEQIDRLKAGAPQRVVRSAPPPSPPSSAAPPSSNAAATRNAAPKPLPPQARASSPQSASPPPRAR